jgi:hypothetical protein
LAHTVPVGNDDTLKAPLVLQYFSEQSTVGSHGHPIDVREGRHDGGAPRLHRGPEGPQMKVAQGVLAYPNPLVVPATVDQSVPGEMLGARGHGSDGAEGVALEAPTIAAPSRPASTGASPSDSATRPHRGSSQMSSIGANVQVRPSKAASAAASREVRQRRSCSHAAARLSGIGRTSGARG